MKFIGTLQKKVGFGRLRYTPLIEPETDREDCKPAFWRVASGKGRSLHPQAGFGDSV